MPPVTRIGDTCTGHDLCPARPAISGEPSVTVEGSPVVRVGDAYAVHGCLVHPAHGGALAAGAPHISVSGALLGRIGDAVSCGGAAAQGAASVTAGNLGGGGSGGGGESGGGDSGGSSGGGGESGGGDSGGSSGGGGESGGGDSGGSSGDTPENDLAELEDRFDEVYDNLHPQASDKDKLLLCLPEIAAAESERVTGADRQGWLYLRAMFHRWFGGAAGGKADENTLADGTPYWVDMNWILSYQRAREKYELFIDPATVEKQIMNPAAQRSLGAILKRNGYLGTERKEFNFCTAPWQEWEDKYHTGHIVKPKLTQDGLQAAMAGFTLRALASGYTEPNGDGTHTITVTCVCVFAHDGFNFAEDENMSGNELFFWNCEKLYFSPWPLPGTIGLENSDFNVFRNKYQFGRDFLVLSRPKKVETFQGARYVYP